MLRNEDEEAKPFLENGKVEAYSQILASRHRSLLPWVLTAVSWLVTMYAVTSTGSVSSLRSSNCNCDTTNTPILQDTTPIKSPHQASLGWPTDIQDMHSVITMEERVFSGALDYDKEINEFVRAAPADPTEPQYFGPPSEEIDANWKKLLHGQYTIMTDEEAAPFEPRLTRFPGDNEFHFSPDVYHSLHCLNALRRVIDKDYYTQPGRSNSELLSRVWNQTNINRLHNDHCLDQLRQSILCHGDLTPVPIYSWPNIPIAFGQGSVHTCRKFEPIREWLDRRNEQTNNTIL